MKAIDDVDSRSFRVLSLCSGGGGLDLGVRLAVDNARTVCFVEWDGYAAACLVARMADASLEQAPVWGDLATFDGGPWRGAVDCVVAGWPCPPASVAGKRLGTADSRWIWPAIARVLSEVRPGWFFGENVAGLLSVNGGLAFRDVLRDLAALGFDAEWCVLSAAAVGASQRRERLFILANRQSERERRLPGSARPLSSEGATDADRRGESLLAHTGCERDDAAQPLCEPERSGPAGAGGTADAGSQPCEQRHGPDAERRRAGDTEQAWMGSGNVGSTDRARRQAAGSGCEHGGRQPEPGCGTVEHSHEPGQPGHVGHDCADARPPFPPGPQDADGWAAVLERWPHFAPALPESELRLLSDGLASDVVVSRTDALRVLGNGVVPIVAAAAFTALYRRMTEVAR